MTSEARFKNAVEKSLIFFDKGLACPLSEFKAEIMVETMLDWCQTGNMDGLEAWFLDCQKNCPMEVQEIPLSDCREWQYDAERGMIMHSSGEFFYIQGLRIKNTSGREVAEGWDQPILTQVGFVGGILGLLRVRIEGIPHYLVEAKYEPGNPDIIQICPTLQATFSNLKQAHGGRRPRFAETFENAENNGGKVIFSQWFSEDGGRLFMKRNLGMIVESTYSDIFHNLPNDYRWVSLYQIKLMLQKNSWISPHIRSLVSVL